MSGIVRPATVQDAPGIGWVSVTAWRETYAGIMPDDYLASLSIEQRVDVFRDRVAKLPDRQAVFVALDQDESVVGFGVCGATRESEFGTDGEIFAINIVEAAKRRGLGVRLMQAMADALSQDGFAQVGLWVIEQNAPARRFYEALGGREAAKKDQAFGSTSLVELGYVWNSVGELQDAARELMGQRG
jgi:ribosomal protein S18 acetylase RimI-like enzyme